MSNYPGEDTTFCPKCNATVGKLDQFCKHCGHGLPKDVYYVPPRPIPTVERPPRPEKRFGMGQRFLKLITSPREAMEDIANHPDYAGVFVIVIANVILGIIAVSIVFQKLQFTGPYADTVTSYMSAAVALGIVIAPIGIIIRWLVKSWLVKEMCDSGSQWNFDTAASVTGYAYIASVIFGSLAVISAWLFLPTLVIDTANLELALLQVDQYNQELLWYQFLVTLPLSFIGLLWKSYLGGVGANAGTWKKCSIGTGVAMFFILGLVGLAIDFLG
jgi:hypothetical protein